MGNFASGLAQGFAGTRMKGLQMERDAETRREFRQHFLDMLMPTTPAEGMNLGGDPYTAGYLGDVEPRRNPRSLIDQIIGF